MNIQLDRLNLPFTATIETEANGPEIFLMSTDLIYFTQIVCLQFLEFRDGKF